MTETQEAGIDTDGTDGTPGIDADGVPPAKADEGAAKRRRRRVPRPDWTWLVLLVAIVAVVAAFVSWHRADTDPERDQAALRDRAMIEGTAAIETMNSMDHRDVAGGLKAWKSVTTGVLHDQMVSIGEDEQQLLADQGKVATGHVVQAALTELTDHTATMIAAVEVTVADDDPAKEPTVKRNRFSADLVLVDGHWKLEDLSQVPVNLS